MRRSHVYLIAAIVSVASLGGVVTYLIAAAPAHAGATMEGFTIKQVRFDESMGGQKPSPQIPKSWRFVGVSNGEKQNGNTLWFQDGDGNIYAIAGFTSNAQFTLLPNVHKLEAK